MSRSYFQARESMLREVDGDTDRWIVSYADFITLLFAFFVVMYSISSVNDGKFRVLSEKMVEVFNDETGTVAQANSAVAIDLGGRTITDLRNVSELEAIALEAQGGYLEDAEPINVDPNASVAERVEQRRRSVAVA